MSKSNLIIGRDLGLAICKHFGIDVHKHCVDSNFNLSTEPGKPATVTLTFMLTADDLAGIARAAGADDGEQGPELVNFASPSRVYTGVETRDILRRYAAGTKAATQALTIEPDPRLDEIVSLLKQLVQANSKWDADGMPLRK